MATGIPAGNHFNRLVDAAADLISAGNLLCFPTISEIADHAGLDEERALELFGSLEQLLNTVAQRGMVRLNDISIRMMANVPTGDVVAQVEALGISYLVWTIENPGLFTLVSHRNIADFLRQGDVERYDKGIRQLLERLMLQSQ